jgi:DNA replication protein DnaC
LSGCIKKYKACDLLIIDDLTYITPDKKTAQSFFSIIDKRYSLKSTIFTSNTNIKTWAENFPDESMCAAFLGRIVEESLLLNMNGAKDMRLQRDRDMFDEITVSPQKGDDESD